MSYPLVVLFGLCSSVFLADELSDKIVKFCKDNVGQQVGGGECTHLAEAAMKDAGAKPRTSFPDAPGKDDYVWGEEVFVLNKTKDASAAEKKGTGSGIKPGDVLQMRDVRFEGKKGNGTYFVTCPHHTAVVVDVQMQGKVLIVLEQNVGGKRMVVKSTYRLGDLKEGWIRAYRPAAQSNQQM